MNKYIFAFICLCIGSFTSCSDDDKTNRVNFNESVIQSAEPFTDPRDGITYECVRIGNQIWMTENLRYNADGYTFGGSYTWQEKKADLSKAVLGNEDFLKAAHDVAYNPLFEEWPEYAFGYGGTIIMKGSDMIYENFIYYAIVYGEQSQNEVLEDVSAWYPSFYEAFDEKLMEVKESPEMKRKIGLENFQKAEENNGGYISEYGCLYSHEGALAAAPEGWRLPTDEDWIELEKTLGVDERELMEMEAWRGPGLATLLNEGGKSGLNTKYAGANIYVNHNTEDFINKDDSWYYWSATDFKENDSTTVALIRMSAKYSDKVWRGTSRITTGYRDVLYSVRCVKDAN